MSDFLIFILSVILFVIHLAMVFKMANIAESKGYDRTAYAWAGFFFGIFVFIMIASLKDIVLEGKIDELTKKISKLDESFNDDSKLSIGKVYQVRGSLENNINGYNSSLIDESPAIFGEDSPIIW